MSDPSKAVSRTLRIDEEIDAICSDFDARWRNGESPQLEEFLQHRDLADAESLLRELLKIELEYRRKRGDSPAAADYQRRFAEHPGVIADVLAAVGEESRNQPTGDGRPAKPKPGKKTTQIGNYRLLAKLGAGGMGTVYKALHTRLEKVVALKLLPVDRVKSKAAIARFEREMKAVGRLNHPHIVQALDADEFKGRHFLVMEYVEGDDLWDISKRHGALPVAEACELVRQAALGLQAAHECGMVHRDIKPANLFLAKQPAGPPVVKVLDLGLAMLEKGQAADLTSTGQIMGTIDYMAPEQAADIRHVDIRADVYSLGATLYRLLTQRAIYDGPDYDTVIAKLAALATVDAPPIQSHRADLPADLSAIVHRMLAKDPAERFATPGEVADALAPFAQGANLAFLLDPDPKGTTQPTAADVDSVATANDETARVRRLKPTASQTRPTVDPEMSFPVFPETAVVDRATGRGKSRRKPFRKSKSFLANPKHQLIAGVAAAVTLAVMLAVIVFRVKTPEGTIVLKLNQKAAAGATVTVDGTKKITVTTGDSDETFEITADGKEHTLRIEHPDFVTYSRKFVAKSGGKQVFEVTLVPKVGIAGKEPVPKGQAPDDSGHASRVSFPLALQKLEEELKRKGAPPLAKAPFNARQAKAHQEAWARYLRVPVEYTNSIGMKFRLIPPGEFLMGSTQDEIDKLLAEAKQRTSGRTLAGYISNLPNQTPQHRVVLTRPIYLGMHEVTQRQFEFVTKKTPSWFSATGGAKAKASQLDTSNHPVESITWDDAVRFCQALSKLEAAGQTSSPSSSTRYRLPTEAEWEFACRAGTTSRFGSCQTETELQKYAWFDKSSGGRQSHPVGLLRPNQFGLFDMHGNVWEWCLDGYDPSTYSKRRETAAINPIGRSIRARADQHVIRGGGWEDLANRTASANRDTFSLPNGDLGFRVVRIIDEPPARAKAPFDAKQAKAHQKAWAKHLAVAVERQVRLSKDVKLPMVLIPPGEFTMGSPKDERTRFLAKVRGVNQMWVDRYRSEDPPHGVRITKPFWMGRCEVTVGQFRQFVKETGYKTDAERDGIGGHVRRGGDWVRDPRVSWSTGPGFAQTDEHPVVNVSWNDAIAFCQWLSKKEGIRYTLPTEAQWEYAWRAGTTTYWSCGNVEAELPAYARFANATQPVGKLTPNPFGLYDMHRNAWEWCADWYAADAYKNSSTNDPTGPPKGTSRVLRGGGFGSYPGSSRSAARYEYSPNQGFFDFGFRVVAVVEEGRKPAKATWKPTPAQQAFFDSVGKMSPQQQVDAVRKKLQEENPKFDGKVEHEIKDGNVVSLKVLSDFVGKIWPIRALPHLESLDCSGTRTASPSRGKLVDLSPLRGLRLRQLVARWTMISDLSPLRGMPLRQLTLDASYRINDLSPLAGMPLTKLDTLAVPIVDLGPLKGTPLRQLNSQVRIYDSTDREILTRAKSHRVSELQLAQTLADSFAARTARLSSKEQIAAVRQRLITVNGKARIGDLRPVTADGHVVSATVVVNFGTGNLTPLMGFSSLRKLSLVGGCLPYLDISCLKHLPLEELNGRDEVLLFNSVVLRSIPTLQTINRKSAAEYWKYVGKKYNYRWTHPAANGTLSKSKMAGKSPSR